MKKLLLDTQVLIWLAQEPQKISGKVKLQLSAINELLLSHVSVW